MFIYEAMSETSSAQIQKPNSISSFFFIEEPRKKIEKIREILGSNTFSNFQLIGQKEIPKFPARDIQILEPQKHPPKAFGLNHQLGQGRLIHDLASIELQAMELAFRTLIEFPEIEGEMRDQLVNLTLSEAKHFELCLNCLDELKVPWGAFPVHLALWNSVQNEHLLDRILIVHRYLEGSGLDAGESLLRRLSSVKISPIHPVVETIVKEEIDHVKLGTIWFSELCKKQKLDPDSYFEEFLIKYRGQLPKRLEPISIVLRTQAGFTAKELQILEKNRQEQSKYASKKRRSDNIQDLRTTLRPDSLF